MSCCCRPVVVFVVTSVMYTPERDITTTGNLNTTKRTACWMWFLLRVQQTRERCRYGHARLSVWLHCLCIKQQLAWWMVVVEVVGWRVKVKLVQKREGVWGIINCSRRSGLMSQG